MIIVLWLLSLIELFYAGLYELDVNAISGWCKLSVCGVACGLGRAERT